MVCCAIAGCSNHDRHQKNTGIKFHTFPKDSQTKKKWVNACKRADKFSTNVARVCSKHFNDSDYLRDLKNELLNLPLKRFLKPDAIPHINVPHHQDDPENLCDLERKHRVDKWNNRKQVQQILQVQQISTKNNNICKNSLNVTDIQREKSQSCACNIAQINTKLEIMQDKNEQLQKEVMNLKEHLERATKQIFKLENENKALKCRFSENQQQVIFKRRCCSWSSEDVAKAVTLRCISHKALDFVRDVLKIPLPGNFTIKRRLRQFHVPPGFINLSTDILKSQASLLTNFEKDVVLSFDEMKVCSDICFDQNEELFRGPHNTVQVMVIRSMVGKWMQPIYYNFDKAVNIDLLMETIQVIEGTGFKVRALVSDMGPTNRKLISSMNISHMHPSIKNPADETRNIWVFCDVPHTLKLLRNHLLDEGYKLECGKHVTKEPFIKLLEMLSLTFHRSQLTITNT